MRVLIVEDEARLARTVQDLMELDGFAADVCYDGEAGLDNALTGIYDVCILDVMLPKLDGFTVVRRLREAGSALPVLLLTARSDLDDRVTGLDSGADYYLTKPFEPRELRSCVRALCRRQPEVQPLDRLEFGDLRLEKNGMTLSCEGRSVKLSRKEYDLLELLIRNRGQVLTKETLLVKVWGYDTDAEENSVEVYISFLRKKLEHLRSTVRIRTLRMAGYRLEAPEEGT